MPTSEGMELCEGALEGHREVFARDKDAVRAQGFAWLEVHFAALLRRYGAKAPLAGIAEVRGRRVNLEALRVADFAAAALLVSAELEDAQLLQLYRQGDGEEQRLLLSAAPFAASDEAARQLLVSAHRSNDGGVFCAAFLDKDLAARVLSGEDFNNAVLKCAFLDLPLSRLFGAGSRANPELSRMLLDFMAEREAAARPVWADSLPLAARAPVAGVYERIAGDLWHGEDRRRLAAARASRALEIPFLRAARRERLPHETHPLVREELSD